MAGDSRERQEAEPLMVQALSERLGLALSPARMPVPAGGTIEVDGGNEEARVYCEAWAHQGSPKSAQRAKVIADAFTLALLARVRGGRPHLTLLLSDQQAAKPFGGHSWYAQAIRTISIGLLDCAIAVPSERSPAMQKPSVKHHYLPRYYLNGFTNEHGRFYVYDKREDRIFSSGPSATFFENHLNTIVFPGGDTSDSLEDLYTDAEKLAWPALDTIRASTATTPIDPLDKMNLFLFLLTLHWRLPSNIRFVDQLSEQAFGEDDDTFSYFALVDRTGQRAPDAITELIRSSSAFKKSMRILAPIAPFFNDEHWAADLDNWRFLYSGDGQRWYLVGDNPIITKGQRDHDPVQCLKEFIVPISGSILLANTQPPITRGFPPELVIKFNAALIERSERFVAGSRKDFLEAMVMDYKLHKDYLKTDMLIPELFHALR